MGGARGPGCCNAADKVIRQTMLLITSTVTKDVHKKFHSEHSMLGLASNVLIARALGIFKSGR